MKLPESLLTEDEIWDTYDAPYAQGDLDGVAKAQHLKTQQATLKWVIEWLDEHKESHSPHSYQYEFSAEEIKELERLVKESK